MANNFIVKDGAGATITKASVEIAAGIHADLAVLANASGTVLTNLPVSQSGTFTVGFSPSQTVGLAAGSSVVIGAGSASIGTVSLTAGTKVALKDATGGDITTTNPVPVERKRTDGAGAAIPIKFAVISSAASGDSVLVAAVAGKRIRVLNYTLISAGAVNVTFRDGTTPVTGALPLVAQTGASTNGGEDGLFQTTASAALNLNLSSGVQVSGHLAYIEV